MPIIRGEITETVDISTNGTHNVAQYTSANVNVQPSISSLNVTPTTSAQTITAPQGTDGYSPVNVSAVTSSIDANITAGNIKKDVTILGVTGSYEGGGGSATQHGVNLKGWCGDVGPSGYILTSQAVGTLSMPTLRVITPSLFRQKFMGSTGLVGAVNLGAVEDIQEYGLYRAFENTRITELNLGSLSDAVHFDGLTQCCYGVSTLTSVNLGQNFALYARGLKSAFKDTGLSTLTIPVSQFYPDDINGEMDYLHSACYNCASLRNVYFPNLDSHEFVEWFDWYETPEEALSGHYGYMLAGCSNVTVHFLQNLGDDLVNAYGYFASVQDAADAIAQAMDPDNYTTSGISVVFDIDPT